LEVWTVDTPSPHPTVNIERAVGGQPHRGRVLAIVEPHLDDALLFAGGTISKLLDEGYTGYLIRVSNDEMCGYGLSVGKTVAAAEEDASRVAKILRIHPPIDLGYRNHQIDDLSRNALRARLIFLFRLLKVDTVFTYDPHGGGHYEDNPDHYVTAQVVESACWHAGYPNDYPEHRLAGIEPYQVTERYYFARGPQLVNWVVDTADYQGAKLEAILGASTALYQLLQEYRDYTRARGIAIDWLDRPDGEALREYVHQQFIEHDRRVGAMYGLAAAETFHHIVKDDTFAFDVENPLLEAVR
jgi:LmbE family N-acetylglucosaminyl deacetylase